MSALLHRIPWELEVEEMVVSKSQEAGVSLEAVNSVNINILTSSLAIISATERFTDKGKRNSYLLIT